MMELVIFYADVKEWNIEKIPQIQIFESRSLCIERWLFQTRLKSKQQDMTPTFP